MHIPISENLADEREGAKTYGRQAREEASEGETRVAKTLRSMQHDEQRHIRKLKTLKREKRRQGRTHESRMRR